MLNTDIFPGHLGVRLIFRSYPEQLLCNSQLQAAHSIEFLLILRETCFYRLNVTKTNANVQTGAVPSRN